MHSWSAFVLTLLSLVALSFHTQVAQAEQDAFNTVRYKDAKGQYQTLKLKRDAQHALNWNVPASLNDKISSLSAQTGVYLDTFSTSNQRSMMGSLLAAKSSLSSVSNNN